MSTDVDDTDHPCRTLSGVFLLDGETPLGLARSPTVRLVRARARRTNKLLWRIQLVLGAD